MASPRTTSKKELSDEDKESIRRGARSVVRRGPVRITDLSGRTRGEVLAALSGSQGARDRELYFASRGITYNEAPTTHDGKPLAPGRVAVKTADGKTDLGVMRPGDYARNKAALDEIRSGRVSYDPRAIEGLSTEMAKQYGDARKRGILATQDRMIADKTFRDQMNQPDWQKKTLAQKLAAYSEHISSGITDTKVTTAGDMKAEWRAARAKREVEARKEVLGAAGSSGAAVVDPFTMRGGLGFAPPGGGSGGYSGPNGQPFQAGSPNQRDVKEFARAKGREQTDAAARKEQHYRDWIAAQKEDSEYASYLIQNWDKLRARTDLERAKRQTETAQLRLAKHYQDQATYAARTALADARTVPPQGTNPVPANAQLDQDRKKYFGD